MSRMRGGRYIQMENDMIIALEQTCGVERAPTLARFFWGN